MQKFDMHSTLFQIFPSSNTYTSLVAGAATVLVKVSRYGIGGLVPLWLAYVFFKKRG